MRKRIAYLFLLLLFLASCRDVVVVEIEPQEEQVVVVSELSPDESIELDLSMTAEIFSGQKAPRPEDATIFLSGTDLQAEATAFIFSRNSNNYQFRNKAFRPGVGESYTLSISIPGTDFIDIQATTTIPVPLSLERAMASNQTVLKTEDGLEDILFDIELELSDSDNLDTYVHIVPKRVLSEFNEDTNGEITVTFFAETEPLQVLQILESHNAISELNHRDGVFVDYSKLNDQTVKLRLSTTSLLDPTKDILQNIEVTVYTLSRELFEYHQNLHKQLINSNSSFSAPTVSFTNIENGIGVFGGMSSSSSHIKL